jgi:hypothetical protein
MTAWHRLAAVVPVAVASCQYPPLPALELDANIDANMNAPSDAAGDAAPFPDGAQVPPCGDGLSLTAADLPTSRFEHLALGVGSGGDAVATFTAERLGWTSRFAPATGEWTAGPLAASMLWGAARVGVGRRGDAVVASGFNGLWVYRIARGETRGTGGLHSLSPGALNPPRLAVGDDGRAMMVWSAPPSGQPRVSVWARRFDPGSGTGDIVEIGPGQTSEHPPELAATGIGDAVVVWRERPAQGMHLVVRRYQVARNAWTDAHTLAQATLISDAYAAFDRRGAPVVAWNELRDGRQELRSAVATADGWGAAQTLATDLGHGEPPFVLVEPGGDVSVLWRQAQFADLWGSTRLESGWSAPAVVIARPDGAGRARVASDEHGNSVAAWPRCDGYACRIEVAWRAASDDAWQRSEAMYPSNAAENELAVGASADSAFVAWHARGPQAICVARVW